MKITKRIEDTKGYFELFENEELAAYMSFSRAGDDLIIINHTDVKPQFKGNGFGRKLIDHIVNYARAEKIKVMPMCPYAASVFRKDETIKDVLK